MLSAMVASACRSFGWSAGEACSAALTSVSYWTLSRAANAAAAWSRLRPAATSAAKASATCSSAAV
jgi:hypothetical protein